MSKSRGTNTTTDRYDERRIIDPTRDWYVVQSRPSSEVRAASALVEAGNDVWLPRFWTVTVRRRRKVEVERLFFPGYMFAGTDGGGARLFHCDGVADVLGIDGPLKIPSGVVQAIADRLTGNVKAERLQAAALFRVNEMRPVVQGPFKDFMARVTELLRNGRVKVDVSVMGGAASVEMDPSMLGAA